jgi:hypothetical protein
MNRPEFCVFDHDARILTLPSAGDFARLSALMARTLRQNHEAGSVQELKKWARTLSHLRC